VTDLVSADAGDVSRETCPPAVAVDLLGPAADRLVPYARLLAGPAIEGGLLGPRERDRLWERHLLNCAAVAAALPQGAEVVDVGTGAGLPGLVWALLRPDLRVTLVDPQLRRTDFLDHALTELGARSVQVRRARVQELAGEVAADIVAARALAPLDRLIEWCLPLVRPGGALWALKGESAAAEVTAAAGALQRGGVARTALSAYGEGVLEQPTRVVEVWRPGAGREGGQ